MRHPFHLEALYVFLGQVCSALGVLAGVKILTSLLSPERYGVVALGMSVINFFVYFIGLPTALTMTRFYSMVKTQADFLLYEKLFFRFLSVLTGTIFLIAILLIVNGRFFFSLIALLTLMLAGDAIFNGIQSGARHRLTVACMQSYGNWSRFLLAGFIVLVFGLKNESFIFLGFFVAMIPGIGAQAYLYLRRIRPVPRMSTAGTQATFKTKDFYFYLIPLVIASTISWGQLFAGRWFLKIFSTYADVGIYCALFQISFAPVLMLNSFTRQLSSPILFAKAANAKCPVRMLSAIKLNSIFAMGLFIITLAVSCVMWALHRVIGHFFIGEAFSSFSYLLPWFVLSAGIYSTGCQLLLSVQSCLKLKLLLVQNFVSLVFALICNYAGAYFWGLKGAIMASVVFSCFYTIVALFLHILIAGRFYRAAKSPQLESSLHSMET